jgi:hypothetical protein
LKVFGACTISGYLTAEALRTRRGRVKKLYAVNYAFLAWLPFCRRRWLAIEATGEKDY